MQIRCYPPMTSDVPEELSCEGQVNVMRNNNLSSFVPPQKEFTLKYTILYFVLRLDIFWHLVVEIPQHVHSKIV